MIPRTPRFNARPTAAPRLEPLEPRRLLSEGSFDATFSEDGMVLTGGVGDGLDVATDVAVQPDGKTVVVGTSGPFMSAARYNLDGSLDLQFGPYGTGFSLFGAGSTSDKDEAFAVALAPDGRILVAGRAGDSMALVRLTSFGLQDESFSGDGVLTNGTLDDGRDVAVQPDGKVLVVGSDTGVVDDDMAVARFLPTGDLDPTFGNRVQNSTRRTGVKTIGFAGNDEGLGLSLNTSGSPDTNPHYGKLLVAGRTLPAEFFPPYDFDVRMAVARLRPNGDLDTSFDGDGKLSRKRGGQTMAGNAVAWRSDGRSVVAGTIRPTDATGASDDIAVYGLTAGGGSDASFGAGGFATADFGGAHTAVAVGYGYGDKVLVAGSNADNGLVVRFTAAGRLDSSFGTGGRVVVDYRSGSRFNGMALTRDGKVTVAGVGGFGQFAVARLYEAVPTASVGSLDPNAAEAGRNPTSFIVSRDKRLPFATTVLYNVAGTASRPRAKVVGDYAGLPLLNPRQTAYPVTIPAGQTFAVVTLTPVDDAAAEGTETIAVTLAARPAYAVGPQSAVTLDIVDNDGPGTSRTLRATADAYVRDGQYAAQNFGSAADLVVKNNAAGSFRSTYLKFDLSTVTTITTARLALYGSSAGGGPVQVQAFGVPTAAWSEAGITWNNRPAPAGPALASNTVSGATAGLYLWDLTAYLQAERAAGRNVVSILLRSPVATDSVAVFRSDEAAANRPELRVS